MSPMGEYSSWEDCISKNKGKVDNPEAYCGSIKAKVEGKLSKDKRSKIKSIFKKYKTSMAKKTLLANWQKARLLAQIPPDYKKKLAGQTAKYSHGCDLPKTAVHSIGMKNYALIDVCFLREGKFKTNGIPYNYDWETIERDGKSFEGKGFFANHDEISGKEMGIIDKVYTAVHEGTKWLCAKIKIPETDWTRAFLERIQTGLIHDISSTHDFYVDPEDRTKSVSKMVGRGLSTVKEGEVSGARIVELKRNLTNN